MQTSIDLPSQLGVVQTSSLTNVENTDNTINQQIQNALLMSARDKEFRQTNIDYQQNGDQYQVAEIQNGQHTSLIYFIKEDNLNWQLQQNEENMKKEQNYTRSKLLSIEGILFKKSPHWFQGYEQRYCTLSNRIFRYFNVDRKCLQGVLNFDVQSYQYLEIKEKGIITEFILKPIGNSCKVFQFKANPEEIKKWTTLIQEHLNQSMGVIKLLSTLCTYDRFWRHERISTQQLLEEGEDGDLLLFRGKDLNCQMQRAFTQSQYDHVAMLVIINDILYFFEALPLHGVGLCKWSSFLAKRWFNLYEKITFRKLQYQRSDKFKQRISIFVNENLGKSYSLNPSKLFKFTSIIDHHEENNAQEIQKSRTYFCSELVAACYKSLNLLPKDPSSAQYWPGNFSKENSKLKLGYGELSEEYLIDFAAD